MGRRAAASFLLALFVAGCGPIFIVAAGVGGGVGATLRGNGGGETHAAAPAPPVFSWFVVYYDDWGVYSMKADPNSPTTLYVLGGHGIAKLADSFFGTTWSPVPFPAPFYPWAIDVSKESVVYAVGFDAATNETDVFMSPGGSGSWTRTGLPGAVRIAADPDTPMLAAASGSAVFLRGSSAASWFPTASVPASSTPISLVAIRSGTIAVLAVGGLVVSWDQGASWSLPYGGPAPTGLAILGDGSIMTSSDGSPPVIVSVRRSGSVMKKSPATAGSLGLLADSTLALTVYGFSKDGLFVSGDGGATWALSSGSPPCAAGAVGSKAFFVSTDTRCLKGTPH